MPKPATSSLRSQKNHRICNSEDDSTVLSLGGKMRLTKKTHYTPAPIDPPKVEIAVAMPSLQLSCSVRGDSAGGGAFQFISYTPSNRRERLFATRHKNTAQ